jgi:hypothetical protein
LLNLSTNPLESVYFKSQFFTRIDETQRVVDILKKELDIRDEIAEEWGFDEASDDDLEDKENDSLSENSSKASLAKS